MGLLKDVSSDAVFFRSKFFSGRKPLSMRGFISCYIFNPEFRLVFWFRVYSFLYRSNFKILGLFLYQRTKMKFSSDIHPSAMVGVPFKLGHHMGIVIGPLVRIGDNVYIFNGVTLGNRNVGVEDAMPTVGNNVIIGTGSKVLGAIRLGDDAVIGANSVVLNDVGAGEVWAGAPAKNIR